MNVTYNMSHSILVGLMRQFKHNKLLNATFLKSHLTYIMRIRLHDRGKINVVCVECAQLICAFDLLKLACAIGKSHLTFKMSNAKCNDRI